jgi:alpha-beta hydrolase superfamily lysophospholipase
MAEVRVLELRIHGVANAPPADMLCTTTEQVERKDGDEQGSFWRIKPVTSTASDREPDDKREVVAEAYSWGNQARSGGSGLALIGRAVVHICWLFVLPFGLCNLAYWARRDIKGTDENPQWWAGGDGAVAVRIFALIQTLFYAVGFLTVFVYLMGLQCFRAVDAPDGDTTYLSCAALPGWLDFLATWNPTARAALFSLAPIAVILLIFIIGRRARGPFNPQQSFDDDATRRRSPKADPEKPDADVKPPRPPLLGSAGFWHRAPVAQTSERSHLAGAIALVLLLLAADALLDSAPDADPVAVFAGFPGRIPESTVPFLGVLAGAILLAGAFVVTAAAGMSGTIWSVRSKRAWSTALLLLSIFAYGAWLWWTLIVTRVEAGGYLPLPGDSALRGLIIAPVVLAATGALIAVASLNWGYRWRRNLMWLLLPLALVSVAAAELWARNLAGQFGWVRPALSWTAVALVVLAIVVAYLPFKDPEVMAARRIAGWHGNGAAVIQLLALLASLTITSLFVLGTHAWLTADTDEAEVEDGWRTVDLSTGVPIAAPPFHDRFAGMLVVILIVFGLFGLLAATSALRRFPAFSLPGPGFEPNLGGTRQLVTELDPSLAVTANVDPVAPKVVLEKAYPPNENKPSGRLRAVADARRVASLAHRGEPLLRVLAILAALALVPLAIPYFGELLERTPAWDTLSAISRWALGLLALAAVAWVVTNAVTSTERPLGLIWDIICFFPRAGHPFTPPCYAERAVPEVGKRIKRWMREVTEEGGDPRVVLSAHSMGAAIAVGAVMFLHGEKADDALDRTALLTHGAQLRAYFSRFFPEVFGARVLGVRGTLGPALLGADPWKQQVIEDAHRPARASRRMAIQSQSSNSWAGITGTRTTWWHRGGGACGAEPITSDSRSWATGAMKRTGSTRTRSIVEPPSAPRGRTSGRSRSTTTTCLRRNTGQPGMSSSR